jgi:aspartyl-tRNA(Asn)/glutamyl-tRNA(Gln) amidotransferase subunit B
MAKSTPEAASVAPEVLAKYEPVIGLEVHVQLLTRTKIFCGCSTRFGDPPNTNVCPVCLGLPGTLPVLNKRAVEMAMRAAIALNCTVHDHSRFARKNYFYPDLPKGYQISQYELPLATGGWLEVEVNGAKKRIGITRLHLEEDAAKNLHEGFSQSTTKSYVDFNRGGTPLAEIVSEPEMRGWEAPAEAYAYLTKLRQTLLDINVSDVNMEEGSLRCDANVSVRARGSKELGTKVEVKNLNSFRFLKKALEYEIERHIDVLESGRRLSQETRLWNQAEGRTVSMRSKEKAHDYRYFPEPDLLPVHISSAWLEATVREVQEMLAAAEKKRVQADLVQTHFISDYGVTANDAELLTATRTISDYFEDIVKAGGAGKAAANWILTELLRWLNEKKVPFVDNPITPVAFAEFLKMIESGKITGAVAKKVFATMFESGRSAADIVAAEGLGAQVSDSAIEQAAREVIAKNPDNVAKFKSGNEGVFKFFVGQVMKATRGQANPQLLTQIVEILTKILGPASGVAREKYEHILNGLRDARNWAQHVGQQDAFGRFSEYERNIEALIRVKESENLDTFVKAKGNDLLMWSLVESMELADFPHTLRDVDPASLNDRLRKAFKGPILPTGEDFNTNEARNTMFELALASFLSSAGFEVKLSKESDVEARIGNLRFVIECKRLLSEKRFEEQLSKASKQLSGFLDRNPDGMGLIAVDVTKLKNRGEGIYVAANSKVAKIELGNMLETTLRENWNSLKRVNDKRIIGLLLYLHTPAFLREESLLTAAKQSALWPFCPQGSAEYKALEVFASKVTEQVERKAVSINE